MKGRKTVWTKEMDEKMRNEFPVRFSRDIANDLNLGIRTIIRRARTLGLKKEPGFLEKNRDKISKLAQEARPENPTKGDSSFRIPGGEKYQFKKGHTPRMAYDKELVRKVHLTRNKTIEREKLRLKYGLSPITRMNLNPYN